MRKIIKAWWLRVLAIFSIIGPGIIAANADNDAGGITTYSVVGAQFGFKMLWVLFLLTFALAITQEMGARIGLVTRQGLGGVIRENFGVKLTVLAMLAMLVANLGTTTAEFAGVAAAFSLFGVSKCITVPVIAVVIWVILFKGSFKTTQKLFLIFFAICSIFCVRLSHE
jgi:NRAMP (natural resistance-associated macrophage protein)-like metal ion transporter